MDDGLRRLLRERLGADLACVARLDDGWDSVAFDVDDEWIVRVPRRPEGRGQLLQEAALLPLLSPELPAPVPDTSVLVDSPDLFAVFHRKLRGEPLGSSPPAALARDVGAFLAALHGSQAHARLAGLSASDWTDWLQAFGARCAAVLELLDTEERRRAESMFARQAALSQDFDPVLVHGDLGPGHVLCRGDALAGVIDWSDARVGDPALDFAWLLHVPGEAFAASLLDAYVAAGGLDDPAFRERALFFHRLGPWHEVLFGLRVGRPELVESGLAGVRARLP